MSVSLSVECCSGPRRTRERQRCCWLIDSSCLSLFRACPPQNAYSLALFCLKSPRQQIPSFLSWYFPSVYPVIGRSTVIIYNILYTENAEYPERKNWLLSLLQYQWTRYELKVANYHEVILWELRFSTVRACSSMLFFFSARNVTNIFLRIVYVNPGNIFARHSTKTCTYSGFSFTT